MIKDRQMGICFTAACTELACYGLCKINPGQFDAMNDENTIRTIGLFSS